MGKKSEKIIQGLYDEVLELEVGTPETKAYFKALGMSPPSEKQLTFFRVALLLAEKRVA